MSDDGGLVTSTRRAMGRSIGWTLIGLLAGTAIWLPIFIALRAANRATARAPSSHSAHYEFATLPTDDAPLQRWLESQASVEEARVSRQGDRIIVNYASAASTPLEPPWDDLGYTGYRGFSHAAIGPFVITLGVGFYLFLLVRCADVGFLALGLRAVRVAGRAGLARPPLLYGNARRAAAAGLGMGLLLATAVLMIDYGLRAVLGTWAPATFGGWSSILFLPRWGQAAMFAAPILVAVGEETFFRGAVYGAFARADKRRLGVVVSAALFAAVQLNPVVLPLYFAIGVLLVWLFEKTATIVAPVVAHATFLLVVLAVVNWFGAAAMQGMLQQLLSTALGTTS